MMPLVRFAAASLGTLVAGVSGIGCLPKDEAEPNPYQDHFQSLSRERAFPTSGDNRIIVSDAAGTGCYVFTQPEQPYNLASVQFVQPDGDDYGKQFIAGSDRGLISHGVLLRNGDFALALESPQLGTSGVLVTDPEFGAEAYHDLAALGLTGLGSLAQDQNDNLYVVAHNGELNPDGEMNFSDSSTLVKFHPMRSQRPEDYQLIDLQVINAGALSISGDRLLVTSRGQDAVELPEVQTFDISDDAAPQLFSQTPSLQGLGYNDVMDTLDGRTVLTGGEPDLIGVYHDRGSETGYVGMLNLPTGLQGDFVNAAQWLYLGDTESQILYSSYDGAEGMLNVQVASGDLGSDRWTLNQYWNFPAERPVGLIEYGTQHYCVASNNQLLFFSPGAD